MLYGLLIALALQGVPSDTLYQESTEYYEIEIRYPEIALENHALGSILEETAMATVADFKQQFQDYFADDPFANSWYLELNMSHEPSPDGMICILLWEWAYTGGAHGNTGTLAMNFHQATLERIGVVELMGGQERFELLANKVIRELDTMGTEPGWVRRGAAAEPELYHTVLPVPDESGGIEGYTVIFPPYQVECYAAGPMEVYIPAF